MRYRGLHNLMQRRANYRSPGPPLRLRRCHRKPPVIRSFSPKPRRYVHKHRRPVDRETFKEFLTQLERLNRELDRRAHSLENTFDVSMPMRFAFGPAPYRYQRKRASTTYNNRSYHWYKAAWYEGGEYTVRIGSHTTTVASSDGTQGEGTITTGTLPVQQRWL